MAPHLRPHYLLKRLLKSGHCTKLPRVRGLPATGQRPSALAAIRPQLQQRPSGLEGPPAGGLLALAAKLGPKEGGFVVASSLGRVGGGVRGGATWAARVIVGLQTRVRHVSLPAATLLIFRDDWQG